MTSAIALTSGADQPGSPTQHACLELYHAAPATGGSKADAPIGRIEFQFNPKEVTIAKSAKWERKQARSAQKAGPPEFSGADPCKLTVEMFFDATEKHDDSVVVAVEKLFSCCVPTEKSRGKDKAHPPLVKFKWGTITSFTAFVTSVSAKYTLFSANGTPIRATCAVALEEMPGENGKQNPTSGGLAVRKVHHVTAGDSLAHVAFSEYGDAGMWRVLAEYNGIDDPLRIQSGTDVLLPAVEDLIGRN